MAGTVNSFNNQINGSYNQIILNAGTNGVAISTDASAATVNIATGAAVKTTTLGSTNTTSATMIKSGSGNISLNNGLTVDSTGRNQNAIQPAFLAYVANTINNVTGDGTFYTVIQDTVVYDQGSNYNVSNGTFTAPVTGRYMLNAQVYFSGLTASQTDCRLFITTSNRNIHISRINTAPVIVGGLFSIGNCSSVDMDAGDTAIVSVFSGGGTKVVDLLGDPGLANSFGGYLIC